MSENENTVLLEVYRSVGQLESKLESVSKAVGEGFTAVNKRVDIIEQKMDEKKKDFKRGFLYPVMVFLFTTALGAIAAVAIKLVIYLDVIAKQGVKP